MSLRRYLLPLACGVLAVFVGQLDALAQRGVEGTTIISDTLPAVRIEFDERLTYVGTQTVMLSGATRAEQHFLVESDDGWIKRL